MLFTQSGGYMPAVASFIPGPAWEQYRFSFSQFGGTDGHDLTGILFSGGSSGGKFSFQIDDVKFL
jgi:hypothetical protein